MLGINARGDKHLKRPFESVDVIRSGSQQQVEERELPNERVYISSMCSDVDVIDAYVCVVVAS